MNETGNPGPDAGLAAFYAALLLFHETYRADEAADRVGTLDHYRRMFPGFEAAVAAEYEKLLARNPVVEIPSSAEETLRRIRPATADHVIPIEEVARGGMGAVLRVRDEVLLRDLAMKRSLLAETRTAAPGPGADRAPTVSSSGVRRFVQEAQVTAQLDHPGVVPVHELGIDAEGQLFFTMDLVRGRTLSEIFPLVRAEAEGWTMAKAVQVFIKICETLAFAHSRGVIHRDLKPANVMVGGFGEVYLMDWGLAKVLRPAAAGGAPSSISLAGDGGPDGMVRGSDPLTAAGAVLGTPPYMPLEQACGLLDQLDARSDVYSVGAMLYELLTGAPPYMHGGEDLSGRTLLALIRAGPPRPIREVDPAAPQELEAIARKAMARLPGERYGSAGDLAEEFHRYLEGRVVLAHRTGPLVELRKWVARNRAVAGLLAAGVTVVTAGSVGFALFERNASAALAREKREAVAARGRAVAAEGRAVAKEARAVEQAQRAEGNRLAAEAYLHAPGDPGLALLLGIEAFTRAPEAPARDALYLALSRLREAGTLRGHDNYAVQVLAGPDGTVLLSREWGTQAILWDAETGAILHRLDEHADELTGIAFDPGGGRVLTSSFDGTARVWSVATGRCTAILGGEDSSRAVAWASFSPDGRLAATASDDGTAALWDPSTGRRLFVLAGHGAGVHSIEFRPDGGEVATASLDGTVRTWNPATGALRLVLRAGEARDGSFPRLRTAWPELSVQARYSASGERLLCWFHPAVRVFDPGSGELVATIGSREKVVRRVAWHPSGTRLALDLADREADGVIVGVFDLATMDWACTMGAGGDVAYFRFDPSGERMILTRIFSNAVEVRSARTGETECELIGHTYHVDDAVFLPGGRRIASAACDGTVRTWDLVRGDLLRGAGGKGRRIRALSRDGTLGIRVRREGEAGRWDGEIVDLRTGAPLRVLGRADGSFAPAEFGDGDRLALVRAPDGPRLFGLDPFREIPLPAAVREAVRWVPRLSPDGRRLAAQPADGATIVHDIADPSAPPFVLGNRGTSIQDIAWSPDGKRLLTANEKAGTASVWDLSTGRETVLAGHTAWTYRVAWGPGGRRAATTAMDQTARVWDPDTGNCLARAEGLAKEVDLPLFSPDGRVLAVAQMDGVELFDLPDPLPPVLPRRGKIPGVLDKNDPRAWFLPDGRIAVLGADGEVRLWTLDPVEEARRRAPRTLGPQERDRFEIGTPEERERHRAEEPARSPSAAALGRLAMERAEKGRFAEALYLLDRAAALRPRFSTTPFRRAAVLSRRAASLPPASAERSRDADLALASLREAVAGGLFRREPAGGPQGVRADPRFAAIRDDPRFEEALAGR